MTETAIEVYQPMELNAFLQRRNEIAAFSARLVEGKDFGVIAGLDKPSLFKAGAEQIKEFFRLTFSLRCTSETEVITGDEPYFAYAYCATLYSQGVPIANAEGSCNSRESKYRYRWVTEAEARRLGYDPASLVSRGGVEFEFEFAIKKKELMGQYGKPLAYWESWDADILTGRAWQTTRKARSGAEYLAYERNAAVYRILNDGIYDQLNTIRKMAEKRAFVGAILFMGFSEYYTQDLGADPADDEAAGIVVSTARPVVSAVEVPAITSVLEYTVAIEYQCQIEECSETLSEKDARERPLGAVYCDRHFAQWQENPKIPAELIVAYERLKSPHFTLEQFLEYNGVNPDSMTHSDVQEAIRALNEQAAAQG